MLVKVADGQQFVVFGYGFAPMVQLKYSVHKKVWKLKVVTLVFKMFRTFYEKFALNERKYSYVWLTRPVFTFHSFP